jgi:ribosomal protein S18 acetylase RimI-like enzyme
MRVHHLNAQPPRGTASEYQRKGIGSALLVPILERCKKDCKHTLKPVRKENVSFYQRQGFEVRGEVRLPNGPTVFHMVREPDE